MTTIVSDETERAAFKERLSVIQASCSTGSLLIDGMYIKTLEEVLRSTKAVAEADIKELLVPDNKFIYQAMKKFYGCLDAATINGSRRHPDDVCFLVDSDSRMLRNSFCHLASKYRKNKTVFVSPLGPYSNNTYPSEAVESGLKVLGLSPRLTEAVGTGRKVLGLNPRPSKGDSEFGEFYAMESFHWLFEVELVQQFVIEVPLASRLIAYHKNPEAFNVDYSSADILPEELIYHFLYPKRRSWGYRYVDVYDMLKSLVGPLTFDDMTDVYSVPIVEHLFERVSLLTRDQALAIGKAFRHHGVATIRCSYIEQQNAQTIMHFMDMCSSIYTEGSDLMNDDQPVADPPICMPQQL